jgi:sulfur carrier protein ThiS
MDRIEVVIGLHGELRARYPQRMQHETLVLPKGACVADALRELGHEGEAWLVAVNGEAAGRDRVLAHADRLDMFPFIEGG